MVSGHLASKRVLIKNPVIEETPVEKLMSDMRHETISWHGGKVMTNHVSNQEEDKDADVFNVARIKEVKNNLVLVFFTVIERYL